MIRVVHPGSGSLLFTHPWSQTLESKRHRIPDPDPQHCPQHRVWPPPHLRRRRWHSRSWARHCRPRSLALRRTATCWTRSDRSHTGTASPDKKAVCCQGSARYSGRVNQKTRLAKNIPDRIFKRIKGELIFFYAISKQQRLRIFLPLWQFQWRKSEMNSTLN